MDYLGLTNHWQICIQPFLDAAYRNSPYKGLVMLVRGGGVRVKEISIGSQGAKFDT